MAYPFNSHRRPLAGPLINRATHACVVAAAIAGAIACARSLRSIAVEVSAMREDLTDVLTLADADAELRQRRDGTYVGADITPLAKKARSGLPGKPDVRPSAPARPGRTGHSDEASPPRTSRTAPSRRPRSRRNRPTGARRGAAAYEG